MKPYRVFLLVLACTMPIWAMMLYHEFFEAWDTKSDSYAWICGGSTAALMIVIIALALHGLEAEPPKRK